MPRWDAGHVMQACAISRARVDREDQAFTQCPDMMIMLRLCRATQRLHTLKGKTLASCATSDFIAADDASLRMAMAHS